MMGRVFKLAKNELKANISTLTDFAISETFQTYIVGCNKHGYTFHGYNKFSDNMKNISILLIRQNCKVLFPSMKKTYRLMNFRFCQQQNCFEF